MVTCLSVGMLGTFTILGTSGLLKFVSSFGTFQDFLKSFYKNKKKKQNFWNALIFDPLFLSPVIAIKAEPKCLHATFRCLEKCYEGFTFIV